MPTRRQIAMLLPALAAAQEKQAALPSKTFKFEDLPVKENGANKGRAVMNGLLHTGFRIETHLTELGPGMAPHAPHRHVHEEMVMLQTGMLDVTINGETSRITAGSVAFVASNELHGWKNPGPERAQYFVIALGPDK